MSSVQSGANWKWTAGWFWLAFLLHSTALEVSSFQAGDAAWQLGTIALGNLDDSPDLEIVVPYRDSSGNWFLDAFKYNGRRLPGFPYAAGADPMNVSPTLYDLNHKGKDQILFTRANHLIALSADGSVLWSATVNSSSYVPNGGYQTVTNGFYWYPSGAWSNQLPGTAVFSSEVSPPIVTDLTGTGKLEVITAWKIQPDPANGGQDYNPFISATFAGGPWGAMGETWSGGVVTFDALTGRQNFVYHLHHLLESGLAVGRPTVGGPLNIYALNDSDSVVCFDKSRPFGLWGKGMLHGQFGKNQRLMTGSYLVPIDIFTADLDGDGLDEVLVPATQLSSQWEPNETILDHDGAILWRRWLPHLDITNNYGWLNSASLIPVNPDHDNHIDVLGFNHSYEISFRYWNGIELVDHPGWPKSFYPFLPTPPVVGDVDGDGQEEIVIGTYNPAATPSSGDLLIFALDGTLKQRVAVPGGVKQIPALGDVEGLGRLDVAYRSLTGRIYVQNFGATKTNLVSWATHRANMRRDGNHGARLYPAGTPFITRRISNFNRTGFTWTNESPAEFYRLYRAERAEGPFAHIATLAADANSYTDEPLKPGWQYFYELEAVYGSNSVRSAPFAILSFLNSNLVANAGFERNDNCHWDKWFTGTIEPTNMCASTNVAYQGLRSMQILLQDQDNNSTVAQYNQYGIPDSTIYLTPGAFYSFGGYVKSTGLSQTSEHWFEWSSTRTAYDTNDRPALPFPFYFTPHVVIGTGTVDWTYLNRTFQLPAGFPNIELRHRYTIDAPASGSVFLDDLFFRRLPVPADPSWTTLIPFGATWRYLTNSPPANWQKTDFNDSSWSVGLAKFGAGSGPTNIVTRLPQFRTAYYFRRSFVLASTKLEEFLLSATCTDVSVTTIYPLRLFLNGSEVKTFIDVATMQGNEKRYFDLTPFIGLLRPGTNSIAVQIGNYWSDYDDIAFDISLQGIVRQPHATSLAVQNAGTGIPTLTVEAPPLSIWQIQASDSIAPANWRVLELFTNSSAGTHIFVDGQSISQTPNEVHSKFYRLMPY